MAILQVTPEIALNINHIESMVLRGGPAACETVIVLKNRIAPVIVPGNWQKIWRQALKGGWIWTDGKTHEIRS
jgi:hypothetical protein